MTYREVMDLPYKVFMLMNENIFRLLAEKDIRSLNVGAASQSADGMESLRNHLVIEMGDVGTSEPGPISEERDQEGFEALRMFAG
jgi:hypothetical protein